MTSELASLQRRFAQAVVDPSAEAPALTPGGTLTPEGAIGVYRTAYPARLTEQLCETFEAVWSVLGDEGFFRRCREHIAGHPSESYNMSDYGREFPAFLAGLPESGRFPFLAELAGFEWTFKDLFHQKEHAHLDGTALGQVGQDSRFVFGAAVRLLRHRFETARIWSGRKERLRVEPGRTERVALFKLGGEIYFRTLEEPEFALLEALRDGGAVGAALQASEGLDQERVGFLFAFLAESGMVEAIR